jgi:AcrR family transcriptional regulator
MPRSEEVKQRLHQEQRTHILEAARRVFARKGPAATMDDIAAEASVSHGLAYRYFVSKEAILQTLAEQAFQADPMTFLPVAMMSMTPGERLTWLVSALVKSRQLPEFVLLDQMRTSPAVPNDLRERVHKRGHALRGAMRQLIVEGQKTGEVAAGDPDQLVNAVLACLDGLTRWAELYPEQDDEHFPDAEIFLRMLKP